MISPFAPLFPWLCDALDDAQLVLAIAEPDEDDPRPALDACDIGDHLLDLRHGPTRYAVLRALAEAGHARPWALGAPWSPLTDEQAGRVTAEIVRAVGADPGKVAGVVPDRVLSEWFTSEDGDKPPQHYRHGTALAWREVVIGSDHSGRYACVCQHAWMADLPWDGETPYTGPETGEPGRLAADTAARALGCIMIEEITP